MDDRETSRARKKYKKKTRRSPDPEDMGKFSPGGTTKERKKKRERWLLTRKTWRYMADAGRRLVPDGHNKPEDVPKIEAYFQEVCNRESKFLLWRKQSYPGALGFRKGRPKGLRKKGGSCRDRTTNSADESEELKVPETLQVQRTSPGKFDVQRLRREFLFGKTEPEPDPPPPDGDGVLLDTLHRYLYDKYQPGALDHAKLLEKLKEHLAAIESTAEQERRRRPVEYEGDPIQKSLLETLRRYYSKSPNRQKVISDLLTDRKKLEKLYFDLRQARGFMGGRRAVPGGYSSAGGSSGTQSGGPSSSTTSGIKRGDGPSPSTSRRLHEYSVKEENEREPKFGTPPLIVEIEPEPFSTWGTQTDTIAPHSWVAIAEEVKKLKAAREAEEAASRSTPPGSNPRRSSVDNDDVSPSVSDTIKRYLRMARKKSVDADKIDRFKRVNYDRNLRNIKPKGEITSISDDDGLDKGIQTDESWIEALQNLKIDTVDIESAVNSSRSSLTEDPTSPTSPTTKSFLSSGQSFLSNLLHGLQDRSVSTGGMQKSKSSTSVVQQGSRLVAKKIWKSRSKSQSRATPSATSAWTPQGQCTWSNVAGRTVTLSGTTLSQLTEIERRVLQKVALAKLQALNLGVTIKIPSESSAAAPVQKPKRRAYLLKRKAITTSVFDTSRKDDKEKGAGMVFGVPLGQCVENERARICPRMESEDIDLRRKSHHGTRGSFSSLIEAPRPDEGGSCESLISPTLSMPGLDNLSCGSTQNLMSTEGGGIPNIVASCLRHLENHGLYTRGIFRVSSSIKRVRQLREEFDCGKEINLEKEICPHDVATLLKEYFRDLPDALLCKDLYYAFIQTQRIRNRRLQQEALKHLIQLLPLANRDTLLSLLNLLALVASKSTDQEDSSGKLIEGNKMDSNNLATLFAPNLLHPCIKTVSAKDELSAERAEERADAINVIRSLIDNYTTLFQVSAELLDEVYVHMMDSHPEALDQLLRRRDTSLDELDDATSGDIERKVWSREACTHETAGMGGPDHEIRPRLERGRERLSRGKRKDDIPVSARIRVESESSSRRTSSTDEKTRISSSDSGRHTPDETNSSDGIITASLKIPVPAATSFSLNLDDIPFIEDNEKQHITLGLMKSSSCQRMTTSESGLGSGSGPPSRPASAASTSWCSTPTSPECEPTTAIISFPTKQQAVLQKVTIKSTSELQQVQPGYSRSESYSADRRPIQQHHLLTTEKISKSASTSTMLQDHQSPLPRERSTVVTPSITSIGGAVLRSKTADIERMLRLQAGKSKKPSGVSPVTIEKEYKRRYGDTRHLTRHLPTAAACQETSDRSTTASTTTSSSRTDTTSSSSSSRSVWKRHELISSEPKERKSFF